MPEIVVKSKPEIKPPAHLNIYHLHPVPQGRDVLRALAKPLGLHVDVRRGAFTERVASTQYTEGPWTLNVYHSSGGWKHRNVHLWQVDDRVSNFEISDSEAFRLAMGRIVETKLANERELRPLRVTRLRVAEGERGKPAKSERVIDIGVVYERVLDGLSVEGPGGKTVVYLDHDRQLTGMDHLARSIDKVQEPVKALRPVEFAIDQIRRRFSGPTPGRVEITGIRLGYFEMNYHQVQEYLQPAYVVFIRHVSQDERISMPAVFAFPAAENSVGLIEPEPAPQPAQRPRG